MGLVRFKPIFLLLIFISLVGCQSKPSKESGFSSEIQILPPEELYGDLFYEVQSRTDLFSDSKTFVDAIPKRNISVILSDFEDLDNNDSTEVMMSFLQEHFFIPEYQKPDNISETANPSEHIENLWGSLRRPADTFQTGTKIPLPNPYIVPGGRFREVYYWDSYFTMLGLKVGAKDELIDHILANFSFLIDSMGFVPNGNRTYYNTRSQPPFYALMVELGVEGNPDKSLKDYHRFLLKEYDFWMAGVSNLSDSNLADRRVVELSNGDVLNRYWDEATTPRPESYREDVLTVKEIIRQYPEKSKEESYRHLRAAAESGWDFSTRWFEVKEDGVFDLSTIHTTDIIPVDLNALLYHLEMTLSKSFEMNGMELERVAYQDKAIKRKALINSYCWNEEEGFYMDYDFKKMEQTPVKSLAGLYPLFFGIATEQQASRVTEVIKNQFLNEGGVVTTLNDSGQQWDYPNGWAPLQWMTIKGLRNYGQTDLADEIKKRWLALNSKVFENTGKMMEKYNVVNMDVPGGGGEYPNQDGFGWTNGVFQKLFKEND